MAPQWAAVVAKVGQLECAADDGGQQPVQTEYLWPCNVKHWAMWRELRTQWRMGMSGPTGLCYDGMRAHLEVAHGLRGKALRKAWHAMRACEEGTLQALEEDRQRKEANKPSAQPGA